jgi:hypothetical protein
MGFFPPISGFQPGGMNRLSYNERLQDCQDIPIEIFGVIGRMKNQGKGKNGFLLGVRRIEK